MALSLDAMLKNQLVTVGGKQFKNPFASPLRCVNKMEAMSLLSLLAYSALQTETPIEELQNTFLSAFSIDHVDELMAVEYDAAIQFLMEWSPELQAGEVKLAG